MRRARAWLALRPRDACRYHYGLGRQIKTSRLRILRNLRILRKLMIECRKAVPQYKAGRWPSRNHLPYLSTAQKLRFLNSLKRIDAILTSIKERQAMSIIIRIVVVAMCAFAGSAVAGIQFSDLPEQHQVGPAR
jgi:hypothetical protein